MLLTGVAFAGGALALGAKYYRSRPSPNHLAATLRVPHPDGPPGLFDTALAPHKVTGRLMRPLAPHHLALGGLAAGGSLLLLATAHGYTPLILVNRLVALLRTNPYGPLLYIAADMFRPLTFFPDVLMDLSSGLIFGPVKGVFVSLAGFSASSLVAYHVGRALRQGSSPPKSTSEPEAAADPTVETTPATSGHHATLRPLFTRYGKKMQQQPFTAMVLLHGMFLHTDTINCLAGYLGLAWRPFLFGGLLGTLPSTAATVIAGSSLQSTLITGVPSFNPVILAASGVIVAGSVSTAYYLQKRDD
ncbi:MAG TPA: VTT domain-containing protein [Caldilineaceae bacterium]|nr:VTT domain-containing protein [Caldilineaceae bacterium]